MKGCDKCNDDHDKGRRETDDEAAREDGVMERHWGEILERSFSNHDLREKSVSASFQEDPLSDGVKAAGNGSVTFTVGKH